MSNGYLVDTAITRTLKHNQNWLCFCGGQTGSGKSLAMACLMELILIAQGKDPLKYIKNIVFTVEDFMKLLNSEDLEKGDVILFDEAGVDINNRAWASATNKAFNYVTQTFRHKNLTVLFTAPSFGFVDSAVRLLFHHYLETERIIRSRNKCEVRINLIQFNPKTGKPYFKYPIIMDEGVITTLKFAYFDLPSAKFRHAYEKKQTGYKNQLGADIELSLAKAKEIKVKKKVVSEKEIIKKVLANKDRYMKTYQNRPLMNKNLVEVDFNVGRRIAERVKAGVEASF